MSLLGTKMNNMFSGTNEFLESNSIIAKIAFLLLVLIMFIILLRLGVTIISYLINPPDDIKLINGMIKGTDHKEFNQDVNVNGSKTILRSVNQSDGLEFTWSVWIFLNGNHMPVNTFNHIFHKGSDDTTYDPSYNRFMNGNTSRGIAKPNNGPGLYLGPTNNELTILMNTFSTDPNSLFETINIKDVPVKKWVNIIIMADKNILTIFLNGTAVSNRHCGAVLRQNYDNVYIGLNGGFDGYISNLWYWNRKLNATTIDDIIKKGPDMTLDDSMDRTKPSYLSDKWFFDKTLTDMQTL